MGLPLPASQLRLRMAAPAVAALAAMALVAWSAVERMERASADSVGVAAARAGADAFLELLRTSTDELGATLGSLGLDDELTRAVAARDVRRILTLAGPIFHDLRLHHGVTHWSYWEPEPAGSAVRALRNLVRLGTPTLRGDVVQRETLARAVSEHAVVFGLDLGYTGFGLRAVAPLRADGRVVGYGELGRNVELLVADLAQRTGDAFAVALDKRAIDPRRWAAARAARGERNNWDDREDLVLAGNPAHAGGVPARLFGGGDGAPRPALGSWSEGRRTFARGAFPLRDAAGRTIGAVVVFRDVTELARRGAELRRRAAVELAVAAALAAALLGVALEVLVVRAGRPLRAPRSRAGGGTPGARN